MSNADLVSESWLATFPVALWYPWYICMSIWMKWLISRPTIKKTVLVLLKNITWTLKLFTWDSRAFIWVISKECHSNLSVICVWKSSKRTSVLVVGRNFWFWPLPAYFSPMRPSLPWLVRARGIHLACQSHVHTHCYHSVGTDVWMRHISMTEPGGCRACLFSKILPLLLLYSILFPISLQLWKSFPQRL